MLTAMSVVSTARRRAGVLWLAQGVARRVAGVSPGYRPRPHDPAPEGRTFVTIDLQESPLRGSQIIMRVLPRAFRPTSGRPPPWANHKASLRDLRRRNQKKTITLNHPVCTPICVLRGQAAQVGLRNLHAKHVPAFRLRRPNLNRIPFADSQSSLHWDKTDTGEHANSQNLFPQTPYRLGGARRLRPAWR